MTLTELAFDTLKNSTIRDSLINLDKRRRLLERGGNITAEVANNKLLPSVRQALIDLNKERDWRDVDAISWGRWLYTTTGIRIYESQLDAEAACETYNALKIIRF